MGIIKRNLWLAAAVFGAVLLVFGAFFVCKAFDAKALITAELADEAVITGDDAAHPVVGGAETDLLFHDRPLSGRQPAGTNR